MRFFKWIGIIMLSLAGLAAVAVAGISTAANRKAGRLYDVAVAPVAIPTDPASIARGRHLSRAVAKCVECHGEDLGGTPFIDAPVFASVPATNLTRGRGGIGSAYSDLDFLRVIRHGVMPDGRAAFIMPSEAYRHLSDEDVAAVIAYVRSMPPVDREWPDPRLGLIGRALVAFDKLPAFPAATFDQTRADVAPAPPADTTVAYGLYLARVGGCQACHGQNMAGKPPFNGDPNGKPSSNLTPTGISDWTEADFVRVLREGKGIGGRDIDSLAMPWKYTGELTDAEIHALWLYLRSLPPRDFGAL